MNGFAKFCVGLVVTFIVAIAVTLQFAHKIDNQNMAIVQTMTGNVIAWRDCGWFVMISPTIWEYSKAGVYNLNGHDGDTLKIQFNNKSTADLNCMIGYRIDGATDEQFIKLHQQVEGSDEKIWRLVITEVNTIAQCVASQFDPSEVIGGEKFPEFVKALASAVMHNEILLKQGIDVDVFKVDGKPDPDPDTKKQFAEQREAALAKKEQIEKSGAITEKEKMQLEIDMKTKIGVADAYGKALASAKLPQMMVVNGSDGKSANVNPFDILLQTMTLEKLNSVAAKPAVSK